MNMIFKTQCEACQCEITVGDMVSHDHASGLTFCADCSPTWADMMADPTSYHLDIDEHGEPIMLTPQTAEAALATHLNTGGSLNDKFGLCPW